MCPLAGAVTKQTTILRVQSGPQAQAQVSLSLGSCILFFQNSHILMGISMSEHVLPLRSPGRDLSTPVVRRPPACEWAVGAPRKLLPLRRYHKLCSMLSAAALYTTCHPSQPCCRALGRALGHAKHPFLLTRLHREEHLSNYCLSLLKASWNLSAYRPLSLDC